MDILEKFGGRVREIRLAKGWTQERLAAEAELSRQYVGDVERGTRNISLVNIHKLAVALGVPISEFTGAK
jgi:transcriptional regulator with XRE-family HTH domain